MALTLEKMYEGIPFSPPSTLTQAISATDTVIYVANIEHFPDAPNIATIGTDNHAETIIYAAKTDTGLNGCVRGIEGIAKDWDIGSVIGRNFTNEDYRRVAHNILAMKQEIENQEKQINDLSKSINNIEATRKLKTYINLKDLGLTNESTFSEIVAAMPNNSSLEFSSYNPLNWFPASVTGDRNDVEIKRYSGGVDYIKVKLSNIKTGVWKGYYSEQTGLVWEKMATTTKTSFSLGAGAGYMIISQNCYIQNGQTYINVLIKKIDGSAFGTGNLYIAASNTIPAGVFPCASIGYKNVSGENVSSAIPNFIQATVASKNVMISNTVADLKAIAINAIIG